MIRLTYHNRRTYHSPSIQGLRAIDQSPEVRYAPVIDKYDGDRVFKANAVVEHFGEFQDVKRYIQNDWETLPRYPAEIPSSDGIETVEAFPAYPEEVLYVAQQGLTSQAPDINPIEVFDDDGMESFPDPSQQGDFSNFSFCDSDSYNSNYNSMHSMADRWTLNQLYKDARLQPPFFALPMGALPSTEKIDLSEVRLKIYSLCVNHRTERESSPHFACVPGVVVKKPAEFLRRFSATLLWSLRALKDSLRVLETTLEDGQAEYVRITTMLQSELGLSSPNDVKSLVEKMIDYLQELRQHDSKEQTLHNQATRNRPPLSRHDIAVLLSYIEKHPDTLQDDIVHRGLFHVCDSQGREQLMCRSCYRFLYPLHNAHYIMNHVGAHGDYDVQKGSIVLRPQDSEDLQQLCLLDSSKVGCVTELIIDLSWDASTEDIQAIHALAGRLGLTSLTIATTALAPSDSTSSPSPPLAPLSDESSGSLLEKIKRLCQALLQGLKHLCISSHVVLNAPALLFELRRLPPQKNVVVVMIKEPSSRCLAGLYNGNIQLLDLGTTLDRAKNITTTGYFAGNLQSISITVLESLHSVYSLLTYAITTILRKNPNISLLTFYCKARLFRMMEAMMKSIYSNVTSDQAPDSRLYIYTLIDNSNDHLVATYKLSNSRDNKAIIANVTTRKSGSDHEAFLDNYGLFIQTLNTNDMFGTSAIDALHRSITRESSSQLRTVTISVSDLDLEGALMFSEILKSSNATLKQLVLVGTSVDSRVSNRIVDALESLNSVEVICFDDGSNTKQWIDKVQDSLPESNSLTALDRVDDLCKIVPGHDDTSLDWLKIRQARGKCTALVDESRHLPFKKVSTELFGNFMPKRGRFSSKGYRSVDNTPWKFRSPAITKALGRFLYMLAQLNESLREQVAAKEREETMLREQVEFKFRQEQMQKMQLETFDRLIVNQQRVDAILSQNYELQEYPIPRLFIVLPDSFTDPNPRNLLKHRFRLFFLCECGDDCRPGDGHGTSSDQISSTVAASTTTIPVKNSIHLAKHEGYELSHPTEFFDRYGLYVLAMLRIFKQCLVIATVTVPAAVLVDSANKDVMEGVGSISGSLIEAVDMSINFLETMMGDIDAAGGLVTTASSGQEDNTMFENLVALEGADLRLLDTFLRNKDEDRVLGNLYRITTEQGDVKWVCFDHYKQTYRLSALTSFVQFVESAGGTYNPQLGQVTTVLKSNTASKDFFRRLVSQGPVVQTLDVTLDWDTSSTDLQDLKKAVVQSSVTCLVLDLCNKASPVLDALTFSSRSEPIIQIMASPRIHTLTLRNITGFLSHTKKLLKTTLHIRHFDLGEMITSVDEVVKLEKLIRASPSLTDLTCRANNIDLVLDHIVIALKDTGRVDLNICIQTHHSEAIVEFEGSTGGILSIDLQVQSMEETHYFNHRMIKSIHIRGSNELSTLLDRFDKGLKIYSKLESVRIECPSSNPRGWLVAFQTLFAQYPHQTPQFSISNNKSTITADNIQENESVEEIAEHLDDDNTESLTEPAP